MIPAVVQGQAAVAAALVQYDHGVVFFQQGVDEGGDEDGLAAAAGAGDQHVFVFQVGMEGIEEYLPPEGVGERYPGVHKAGAGEGREEAKMACPVDVFPQAEAGTYPRDEFGEEGCETGLEAAEGLALGEEFRAAAQEVGVESDGLIVEFPGGAGAEDEEEFHGEKVLPPPGQGPDQLLGLVVAPLPGRVPLGLGQGVEVAGADALQFGQGAGLVHLAEKQAIVDVGGDEIFVDGILPEADGGEYAEVLPVEGEEVVVDGDVGDQEVRPEEGLQGVGPGAESDGGDGGVGCDRW